jgi:peptidoglycan/LPS O-acetylase OafA/YrhL
MLSSSAPRFIPRIESLRGVAALTVAAMHVSSSWVDGPSRSGIDAIGLHLIKALSNGYGAVVAFFVISGFVLARSLDRNFSAARFLRARILRLFPAAIATVGLFAALYYGFGFSPYGRGSYAPLNILANMLMFRADIDAVMWSMKVELAATPLIFACTWLFRRYGAWPVIATGVLLFALSFIGQYSRGIGDDANLAPLYAFPTGVLLHFKGREFSERLSPAAATLCALAAVAVFCGCSFFKPTGTWTLLVQCVSAAVLVMLVAYRSEAVIFAPLDLSAVRFYGKISYSFYLLHPLSLWSVGRLATCLIDQVPALPVSLIVVAAFVFSIVVTAPLAYASWRLVERPAMNRRSLALRPRFDQPLAVSADPRAT